SPRVPYPTLFRSWHAGRRRSGSALLPARQVGPLLVGQLFEPSAEAGKLDRRHLAIDLLGERVDAGLEILAILNEPFGGECLVGEGHVHNVGGVAFCCPEVQQTALGGDEDRSEEHTSELQSRGN